MELDYFSVLMELYRLIAAEEDRERLPPLIQQFRVMLAEEEAKLIKTGLRKPPQSVRLRRRADIGDL
jgi:hypothetical protein